MKLIQIAHNSISYVDKTGYENISITVTKLSNYCYRLSGDFSTVNFDMNESHIRSGSGDSLIVGIPFARDASNTYIDVFTLRNDLSGETFNDFDIYDHKGHPVTAMGYMEDAAAGAVDASDIYTAAIGWIYGLFIVDMGYANGFKIAAVSFAGALDVQNEGAGEDWWDKEMGIVWAHGSNSNIELTTSTKLDLICAVAAGSGGVNTTSYGDGLEFFLDCDDYEFSAEQSWAAPTIAGIIAKLMTNHPTWNFHDCRQALRQSASFWSSGWVKTDGFGAVDYDVANAIADEDLLCMSPFRQEITVNASSVDFAWMNSPQSILNKTVIARFDSEPVRTDTPTADEIIYEGTDEAYHYSNYGSAGTFWFVFYSVNDEGNYSRIESYDVSENEINESRISGEIYILVSGEEQETLNAERVIIESECPNALVTTRIESLSESITYALNNNYSIISRSVFGLTDTINEGAGDTAWDGEVVDGAFSSAFSKDFDANVLRRVGIVHSFGEDNTSKEFAEPTRLDVVCSVAGTDCNYGDGLEFITDDTTSSIATARVAGVIAQIMIDNPTWNFHDARMALRQTASFYATGWIADGGYGAIDKTAAKAVTSLELSSPTRVSYSDSTFTWVNSWLADFDSTVIALSCNEPARGTDINDLYVLYDGSLEEYDIPSLKLNGDYWIVYLSKNSDSDYSEIESFDKDEMTFTYTAENVSCSVQAQTINCTLEAQTINCTLEAQTINCTLEIG